MQNDLDRLKNAAALRAVAEVEEGMVVGLGTGSTAEFALKALAERVAAGLKILGIPTSQRTADFARRHAIPLTDFSAHRDIDLTIDGADQIELGAWHLIKGGGGALLREKIVASASRRFLVIADNTKLVPHLGSPMKLPVEVIPFGHERTIPRLEALGLQPELRMTDSRPFATDSGNYILDCHIDRIADAPRLERDLKLTVGVVESGLFVDLATKIIVAAPGDVSVFHVPRK
jgi:ribose 5-phosphate isomerase A